MLYIIIRIGCLCCDTPTKLVGVYKDKEKAYNIFNKCDSIDTSEIHQYEIFEIDENNEFESYHIKRVMSFFTPLHS